MNQLKVFTIPRGDWVALYVNGELKIDRHNIRMYDIKHLTPIESIEEYYIDNFDSDEDSFPETIAGFPRRWNVEMID